MTKSSMRPVPGNPSAALVLTPAGADLKEPNVTTWGAGTLGRRVGGLLHMYAAEMVGGCGITTWLTNSQVVHYTADAPTGPWTREDLLNARPDSPHAHATAHARWGRVVRAPPHAPPVFVLTARHLLARRTHVVATLASVSLDDDVTLVLCADAAEARLPDESTCACTCIHMHMCMHMCICICICICM